MTEELAFQLDDKITFADVGGGQEDETMEINLRGPTYRDMAQATKLEQHVYYAFRAAQQGRDGEAQDKDGEPPEKMSPDHVMVLLSMFSADLSHVLADFEKLALKVGYINEKTDFLPKHFRSLKPATIKRMCGEYIAFFIMPSVLSTMRKAFSGT